MEDLTPQEKIDLIDLVRYAYDNKYIKWHCEMKMDDPVRKIMQRVLTRMFDGATITKNRRAGAYNISFVTNRRFHGDSPDYISGNVFTPSKIPDMERYIRFFLLNIDQVFWPYIQVLIDTKQIVPKYSRWMYDHAYMEPLETPLNEELVESTRGKMDIRSIDNNLSELLVLFSQFHNNFTREEIITQDETADDPYYGRRYRYTRRVLTPQDYGFSLYYTILQKYDSYGMKIEDYRKLKRPLVRRFHKDGELITRLERLAKAFKIFKKISSIYEEYKSFLYVVKCLKDFTEKFINRDPVVTKLNLTEDEKMRNRDVLTNIGLDVYFGTEHFRAATLVRDEKRQNLEEKRLEDEMNRLNVDNVAHMPINDPNDVRIGNNVYNKEEIKRKFFESIEESSE